MGETWTITRLLSWTKDYFERAGLDSPRLCAEVLLAHVLGLQRIELYAKFDYEPSEAQRAKFRELVKQAAEHRPIAQLTGSREFYSLDMKVTPDVLIPRPETEMLVDQTLEYLQKRSGVHATQREYESQTQRIDLDELEAQQGDWPKQEQQEEKVAEAEPAGFIRPTRPTMCGSVWDVCTGSGCVAVAIAKNAPGAEVLATDISDAALEVARQNVEAHGLAESVTVAKADLLNLPASWAGEKLFDVIAANPPYVATNDPVGESTRFEPAGALYAGDDGFDILRPLISQVADHLKPGGIFCVEFGYTQADGVRDLIVATGKFDEPKILKDYQGIERIAVARKKD